MRSKSQAGPTTGWGVLRTALALFTILRVLAIVTASGGRIGVGDVLSPFIMAAIVVGI
jgi:hypothetical protein